MSSTQPQGLERHISFPELRINGNVSILSLNNKPLPQSGTQSDLLNDFLSGRITQLKSLTVKGNVRTLQGVNSINLSKLKEEVVNIIEPTVIRGNITFSNTVKFTKLNVTGRIDGIKLSRLHRDVLYKNNKNIFLRGFKTFAHNVTADKANVRNLNDRPLDDIQTKAGDHIVRGPIVINGNVTVSRNLDLSGAINGSTLSDLHHKFSIQHHSYVIPGYLELDSSEIFINNLKVGGKLNHVKWDRFMSNVIWKSDHFHIAGRKIFTGEVRN